MKYFYPIHLDGGNRGCEAIARSSAILISAEPDRQVGYCRDIELDTRLGLAKYLTLVQYRPDSRLVNLFWAALNKFFPIYSITRQRKLYPYRQLLRQIKEGDIVLFTGGDMLCYDNNEIIYLNDWLHEHGIKTILWGCSMGPENSTPEKLNTLSHFSLIYARECLIYEYFRSLGLEHLYMLPDPAFILPDTPCSLPECFKKKQVIGLNLSNYVMGGMTLDSPFAHEALQLINHIIRETELDILLIPHVTWHQSKINQDDRQMARIIAERVNRPDRLHTLNIDALNYCEIRHIISKCKMFIGARTHAVISAYSMCVPTVALGYSIKSRGIIKDLSLDERLIVNSKDFKAGDLLRSFNYLTAHHHEIRQHLNSLIPAYCKLPFQIRDILSSEMCL